MLIKVKSGLKSTLLKQGSSMAGDLRRLGTYGKNVKIKQEKQYRQDVKKFVGDVASDIGAERVEKKGDQFFLFKDFQKFKFEDTGKGVEYKGTAFNLPKGLSKTNGSYSTPEKQYASKILNSDFYDTKTTTSKYKPLEVRQNGDTYQVIERSIYRNIDKDTGKKKREEFQSYVKRVRTYKNGEIVSEQNYSPYTYSRERGDDFIDKKQVFLTNEKQYQGGQVLKEKVYKPYMKYKRKGSSGTSYQYDTFLDIEKDYAKGVQYDYDDPKAIKETSTKSVYKPTSTKTQSSVTAQKAYVPKSIELESKQSLTPQAQKSRRLFGSFFR